MAECGGAEASQRLSGPLHESHTASPSLYSKVSNAAVLERAQQTTFGKQLLKQQLELYGKIARLPAQSPLRDLTFCPETLQPATSRYVRRVGRPRNEWAVMLQRQAALMSDCTEHTIKNAVAWKAAVEKHCAR